MRVRSTQGLGKFKIKHRFGDSLVIFFMLFVALTTWQSCKEVPTSAEKVYLDTLYYKLKGNEKALNIDEQTLVQRKELIRNVWIPSLQDTIPDIRSRMEDELRGMLTAYDYYLERYMLFNSGTRILMEDWTAFKQETDNDEIDRETFKKKFKELDARIEESTNNISVFAQPIYELEPMWLRYKRMMAFRGVENEIDE